MNWIYFIGGMIAGAGIYNLYLRIWLIKKLAEIEEDKLKDNDPTK